MKTNITWTGIAFACAVASLCSGSICRAEGANAATPSVRSEVVVALRDVIINAAYKRSRQTWRTNAALDLDRGAIIAESSCAVVFISSNKETHALTCYWSADNRLDIKDEDLKPTFRYFEDSVRDDGLLVYMPAVRNAAVDAAGVPTYEGLMSAHAFVSEAELIATRDAVLRARAALQAQVDAAMHAQDIANQLKP